MSNIKILVTGSTKGQFRELFSKAKQLHEKYGPFEAHLCVGDFFGPNADPEVLEDLIADRIDVPLTTYFITGESPTPERILIAIKQKGGEVCSNLYPLGKRGCLTTSQGMRIAFLSGTHEANPTHDSQYNDNDIDKLCQTKLPSNSTPGFDILLTNNWPKGVPEPPFVLENEGNMSLHISRVATALKPRYHFAASENTFYERAPYENTLSGLTGIEEFEAKYPTRFIGLGDVLNKNKQRWFYAFNLTPMSELASDVLDILPENTTKNPYTSLVSNKRKAEEPDNYFWGDKRSRDESRSRRPYICNLCKKEGHNIRQCELAQRPYEKPSLDSCWFCLSNPKIEKHLIVSIGEELYMTLAKGPLLASKDEECKVPGTGHVLIIPVTHYPTFGKVPAESQEAVYAELENYKSSVRKMFEHHGHGMLTFEISRDSARGLSHAHTQLVAIPKEKCELVERTVKDQGAILEMEFIDEIPDDPEVAYFKMELPDGKKIVHLLDPKRRFNLQFGRMIASFVMDMPQREDWKECKQTEEEEKEEAKLFKAAFKPFDFTL